MTWHHKIDTIPFDAAAADECSHDLLCDLAEAPDLAAAASPNRALISALSGNSPFLRHLIRLEPVFFATLLQEGPDALFARTLDEMTNAVRAAPHQTDVMKHLRIGRRRMALLTAAADIGASWDVHGVVRHLSSFADRAIGLAVDWLLRERMARGELAWPRETGEPLKDGFAQGTGFTVLGLGKLGGNELNYSSDVDLILLYDEQAVHYTGTKSVADCFLRIAQELVVILSRRTAEGYVFRTDLRLRPDPSATPLALSMGAAEYYYQSIGKTWERAAMIKARAIAGDIPAGDSFLKRLSPFVWRKSLDFAAMQDIHAIKRQIHAFNRHGEPQVAGHDVKLGRGGIREIEFFAQIHQLIAGGRDPSLRQRGTIPALEAIHALGKTTDADHERLEKAYLFFRTVEHRLQMRNDEQTQTMPETEDDLRHIAVFCGYTDLRPFASDFLSHSAHVRRIYDGLLPGEDDETTAARIPDTPDALIAHLAAKSFADPDGAAEIVSRWRLGRYRALRTERARALLEQTLPLMLAGFSETESPDAALGRFDSLLSRLPAGVQIFSLFLSNPALFSLIGRILVSAPALGDLLASRVSLIDALLDRDFFTPLPDCETLKRLLSETLDAAGDYADILDAARRWTHEMRFRAGCQILEGKLGPREAGRALSDIADAVIVSVLPHVESEFAKRHGRFPGGGLAVVGFGKYGGHELSYTSDLDLVLLYTSGSMAVESNGEKSLGPSRYFSRLAMNFVTAMTALTGEGRLYDLDLRLRPSGESGPIAVTLKTFGEYQENSAWTWERMALTRARVIVAPPDFAPAVEREIEKALLRPQPPEKLLTDVHDMRKKMADAFRADGPFAVKHVRGGLIDIEFIVQYLLLEHRDPALLHPSIGDAFDALSRAGHLEPEQAARLKNAYGLYQSVQGILRLCLDEKHAAGDFPAGLKKILAQACGMPDFETVARALAAEQTFVRTSYARIIEIPANACPRPQQQEP